MQDKIFEQDAKTIVDLMFDIKLFRENITRDNMSQFEELIRFMLQSRFESYQKATKLLESIENLKT